MLFLPKTVKSAGKMQGMKIASETSVTFDFVV